MLEGGRQTERERDLLETDRQRSVRGRQIDRQTETEREIIR